jgi:hypothetical protein
LYPEPLPERWVDLIHYLGEKERREAASSVQRMGAAWLSHAMAAAPMANTTSITINSPLLGMV